jgi:signal transduction histidine kinase
MTYRGREQLRRVNLIRFWVPVTLFLIVLFYESWEHFLLTGAVTLDIHYTSEILFFGLIGPSAVFLVLSYVAGLLTQQVQVSEKLEAFNQSLESEVAERTRTLAERNVELAHANEELQNLDQLKSDFVALVSHELRGPLTTLNGGLELALASAESLPPEPLRIVQVMARESQRLTDFVQTILDVSKLEAGRLKLNPGVVAVRPLLAHSVDLLWPHGEREIRWHIPEDLPLVWADENYLEQSLCNLLTNADKYSAHDAPVEIAVGTTGNFMEISIIDHGPGIPEAMKDRIFERFVRLERRKRNAPEGWGLGLYFARAMTEAQGGRLTVRSPAHADGRNPGAAFTLSIPLAAEMHDDA